MKFKYLRIGQKFYILKDEKQTIYEKADDFKGFAIQEERLIDIDFDALCVPIE